MKVLIMAGGTGGHVFPGLAIAHALQQHHVQIVWLGTVRGMEAQWVPKAGFPFYTLNLDGLRGKGLLKWIVAPFTLMRACWQAIKTIRKINPDIVLGMGGFASGPGGIAAWLLRKPLYIHEQNAIAGLTNRVLACLATTVFAAFPGVFAENKKVVVVGNPIRREIVELSFSLEEMNHVITSPHPPSLREGDLSRWRGEKESDLLYLLILGGSRGAQYLNQIMPEAINRLSLDQRPHIIHQTGCAQRDSTQQHYEKYGIAATVIDFIDEIADAYAAADLVICRAGALTVSELAVAGVASILIPFPYAVDDHQTANANYLQQAGAAILLLQANCTAEKLAVFIQDLQANRDRLIHMAQAAYNLRKVDATENIVNVMMKKESKGEQ